MVPRPSGGNEPVGGRFCAVARYALVAFAWWAKTGKSWENPPPDPNWSLAISGRPIVWLMKRVAPTAVTHGLEAGHDGHSFGLVVGSGIRCPEDDPGACMLPVTVLRAVQTPALGLVPERAPSRATCPVMLANSVQLPAPGVLGSSTQLQPTQFPG